jgi:hypothetical protein
MEESNQKENAWKPFFKEVGKQFCVAFVSGVAMSLGGKLVEGALKGKKLAKVVPFPRSAAS